MREPRLRSSPSFFHPSIKTTISKPRFRTISDSLYARAREAEAKCEHVWIFEARTLSSQSGDDAGCAGCRGTKLPRTGHPDPWRVRSGTLRLSPRAALGVALVLARPAVANWWISNREGSVSGGLFRSIH